MNTEETVHLSVRIPPKLVRRVDAHARALGLNRTSAVIVLLNQGLENAALPGGTVQLSINDQGVTQ